MSILRSLVRGVSALVRGRDTDRATDDEVQHYLQESARDYERDGRSHDDAVRAATIDMGNAAYARESVRSTGWEHHVETTMADVRYALRRLRHAPGFTVAAILTLGVGIGASTAVFSAIKPVLLEPLPFPNASRLVTIADRNAQNSPMPATLGTYDELRARSHSFDELAVADSWQPSLSGTGDPERLTGQSISANYFAAYGIAPAVGRGFTPDDAQPGGARLVILSDALLRRRFAGDRSIVGRTIDLDGDPYTVVGIMPPSFANVIAPGADVWTPLRDVATGDFNTRAWGHHYQLIGRLAPTASVVSTMRETLAIGRAPMPAFARPFWADLKQGLLVRSMRDDISAPVKSSLYAIVGAVVLLLALATVNVTNLLLARGAQRRPEFAMRVALGAGRARIIRQLLTESVVLALLGGVAGIVIASAGVRAFLAISPSGLPRVDAIRLDAGVLLFAIALTTVVGLAVGLMPALGVARAEDGLQQASRRHAVRRATRGLLVVAEVALAVVLLVSAGLLYRSVTRLLSVAPGFDPSQVITMQVVEAGHSFDSASVRVQFLRQTLDAVRGIPGVTSAAYTSQLPLSGDVDGYGFEAQSVPSTANGGGGSALRYAVTPGYFAALRIPVRRGRTIDESDRAGGPETVVINESLARRLFGDRDPVGEAMRFGPEIGGDHPWARVVGVVGDVKHYTLAADAPAAFYIATSQWSWVDNVQTLIVRTSGDASALAPALERAIWTINRIVPIQRVRTMDAFVSASGGQRRFALQVIETFAVVAFLLAAFGLYAVISGGVIERLREIGIRMALGATPSAVVRGVVARSLLLASVGVVIGVAASFETVRLVRSMLFGVSSVDVVTYAGVVLLMVVMAALASWAPARRAVGVDPTIALRSE